MRERKINGWANLAKITLPFVGSKYTSESSFSSTLQSNTLSSKFTSSYTRKPERSDPNPAPQHNERKKGTMQHGRQCDLDSSVPAAVCR